jgi:hypothetical protein
MVPTKKRGGFIQAATTQSEEEKAIDIFNVESTNPIRAGVQWTEVTCSREIPLVCIEP